MRLAQVGVPGQHVDVIHGGDVHASGRLLTIAEMQAEFRALSRGLASIPSLATTPGVPAERDTDRDDAALLGAVEATRPPAAHEPSREPSQAVHRTDAAASHPNGEALPASPFGCVLVLAAHHGAGASTVALALAEAAAAGRTTHLIEGADPTDSGLLAATTAELGTDPSGHWRRGTRGPLTLDRRAHAGNPYAWPSGPTGALTVLDPGGLGPAPEHDTTCVVVCRASVPGLRHAETLLDQLPGERIALAVVGPSRWTGQVSASTGPRVRALREAHRVVTIPIDRGLETTGLTDRPLPKAVASSGRTLLRLLDDFDLNHPTATVTSPASTPKGTPA